jgi:hypothetical protein
MLMCRGSDFFWEASEGLVRVRAALINVDKYYFNYKCILRKNICDV